MTRLHISGVKLLKNQPFQYFLCSCLWKARFYRQPWMSDAQRKNFVWLVFLFIIKISWKHQKDASEKCASKKSRPSQMAVCQKSCVNLMLNIHKLFSKYSRFLLDILSVFGNWCLNIWLIFDNMTIFEAYIIIPTVL